MMTAVMARTAAGAAIEARTTGRTATAIGASTTFWTTTAAVWAASTSTITPATAKGALETGTRIAADTGGVAREVFARSGRSANPRRTRFTGQQDDVVLDGLDFGGSVRKRCRDQFGFGVNFFDVVKLFVLLFGMLLRLFLGVFFAMLVRCVMVFAESGSVFGAFLRGVGFKIGAAFSAPCFDFSRILRGEFGDWFGMRFFRLALFFLFVDEFGAAGQRVGFGNVGGFLMLGFHKIGGKRSNLIFAELRIALGISCRVRGGQFQRRRFVPWRIGAVS
jgi:hypothetical protein